MRASARAGSTCHDLTPSYGNGFVTFRTMRLTPTATLGLAVLFGVLLWLAAPDAIGRALREALVSAVVMLALLEWLRVRRLADPWLIGSIQRRAASDKRTSPVGRHRPSPRRQQRRTAEAISPMEQPARAVPSVFASGCRGRSCIIFSPAPVTGPTPAAATWRASSRA